MFAQESVMEIKIKRKAFEQWFKTTGFYENAQDSAIYNEARFDVFDINNGFYRNRYVQLSWEAWQAATAQAVPEGFVVLKISDVREILSNASDAICDEKASTVFSETGSPSTWYDHHLVAEKNILDAIEAQEQSHE